MQMAVQVGCEHERLMMCAGERETGKRGGAGRPHHRGQGLGGGGNLRRCHSVLCGHACAESLAREWRGMGKGYGGRGGLCDSPDSCWTPGWSCVLNNCAWIVSTTLLKRRLGPAGGKWAGKHLADAHVGIRTSGGGMMGKGMAIQPEAVSLVTMRYPTRTYAKNCQKITFNS